MTYNVSVIIPMYNRALTIGRALESVFRQTLPNVEIVVVDDGSSDNCAAVVKSYITMHDNLVLLRQNHAGPGRARDYGIQEAHGEYIAFLDSDDYIPQDAYEKMFTVAQSGKHDFVIGNLARKIDCGKWYIPENIAKVLAKYEGENCTQCYDIALLNPSSCNRLVRRDFIIANKIFFGSEVMGEDLTFNIGLFSYAKSATTISQVVYFYESNYKTAASSITQMTLEMVLSGIRTDEKLALFFDKIDRIDWENDFLMGHFAFILDRFFKLPNDDDRTKAFDALKIFLGHYQGRKEYAIVIAYLMGMDLDILLTLPYRTYKLQKDLLIKQRSIPAPPAKILPKQRAQDEVLKMYQDGKLGFRTILKFIQAWWNFKLNHKIFTK